MAPHGGVAERKHRVAGLELLHVGADRLDDPGQLRPQDGLPGLGDAKYQAHDEPEAGRHAEAAHPPVCGGDRGCMHPDQHFVVPGRGLADLLQPKNIGRPISFVHPPFHALSDATVAVGVQTLCLASVMRIV